MVAYGAFYNKKWEKWMIKKNILHICGDLLLGCQSKKTEHHYHMQHMYQMYYPLSSDWSTMYIQMISNQLIHS